MRTYTEKPRTEVDWKGFAYDPYLDGSNRISVGLVATRMLMGGITAMGVPVAAEPLNALTPQYVDGLVTYNGVGARNVTDQTARERVSGFSSVVGFKNSPEGSIDAAIQAVHRPPGPPHEFLGVDRHGITAQLSTTGNDTAHVILRGDKYGPELLRRPHRRHQAAAAPARGLPEVVVVDASHGNSQKNHLRQIDVVARPRRPDRRRRAGDPRRDAGEQPRGRTAGPRPPPEALEYGKSVTDACIDPRGRPRRCWRNSPMPPGGERPRGEQRHRPDRSACRPDRSVEPYSRAVARPFRQQIDDGILDRAAALFARHVASARRPCRTSPMPSGCPRPGLLHHFPSKDALLRGRAGAGGRPGPAGAGRGRAPAARPGPRPPRRRGASSTSRWPIPASSR